MYIRGRFQDVPYPFEGQYPDTMTVAHTPDHKYDIKLTHKASPLLEVDFHFYIGFSVKPYWMSKSVSRCGVATRV